jgi:tRNA (adenine37-N6)-methyltransferase
MIPANKVVIWLAAGIALVTISILLRSPVDKPVGRVNGGNARFVFPLIPEEDLPDAIRFAPIGYFRTPHTPDTGAPRQAALSPDAECEIRISEPYRRGLRDLERFEVIIVLYYFDLTRTWSPVIRPPGSHHRFGLFATRSPRRPNPIGLSVIRVKRVDVATGVITVEGSDAFDGTPVLDIKPYLPSVDMVVSEKNRQTEIDLGHHDEETIKDPAMYR